MFDHDFHKVIRVISFEEGNSDKLAEEINKWILSSSVEIVDIKYNTVLTQGFDNYGDGRVTSYSALVLYRYIDLRKQSKSVPVPPEHMVGIEESN